MALSLQDDKVCGKNILKYMVFLPHKFHGYRLTPVGPLLSVGLEVGIHHDLFDPLFEHHIEA